VRSFVWRGGDEWRGWCVGSGVEMEVSWVGGSIGSVRRAWCCLRVVSRAVVGCETGGDCKSVWSRKLIIDRTVP
jgi:hypothetical protein